MTIPSNRLIWLAIFLVCAFLMAVALYMEYVMELEPCPLCMAQRVAVVLLGVFGFLAAAHNPGVTGTRIYAGLLVLAGLGGAALAARQLWLQSLPEDLVPACGPGIYYMLDVLPMAEVITNMLMGTGDCAEVQWRDPVIGLSIPGWTFVWFVIMIAISAFTAFRSPGGRAAHP